MIRDLPLARVRYGHAMATSHICVIAAFSWTAACSWIEVRRPEALHSPTGCTDSNATPIVDTVPAAIGLFTGLAATSDGVSNLGKPGEFAQAGLVIGPPLLVIGALFAASAAYGYRAVSRCRVARMSAQHPVGQ